MSFSTSYDTIIFHDATVCLIELILSKKKIIFETPALLSIVNNAKNSTDTLMFDSFPEVNIRWPREMNYIEFYLSCPKTFSVFQTLIDSGIGVYGFHKPYFSQTPLSYNNFIPITDVQSYIEYKALLLR